MHVTMETHRASCTKPVDIPLLFIFEAVKNIQRFFFFGFVCFCLVVCLFFCSLEADWLTLKSIGCLYIKKHFYIHDDSEQIQNHLMVPHRGVKLKQSPYFLKILSFYEVGIMFLSE